jgi:hypothetical protein
MTPKLRQSYFEQHMKPYSTGRELDETDLAILKILVNAQLDVSEVRDKMTDMPSIERASRLHSDMMLLLHIWKKKDGAI